MDRSIAAIHLHALGSASLPPTILDCFILGLNPHCRRWGERVVEGSGNLGVEGRCGGLLVAGVVRGVPVGKGIGNGNGIPGRNRSSSSLSGQQTPT
jgi:hypothetical protein